MMDRKDDLPAPDWPMIVRNYPDLTYPFRLWRIVLPVGLWVRDNASQERVLF